MVGPRDGAFIVVAPNAAERSVDAEAALRGLLGAAQGRPVIVINPRLGGGSAALASCEPAYLVRPLELAYLQDQFADKIDRTKACLLRCYPHEWCVVAAHTLPAPSALRRLPRTALLSRLRPRFCDGACCSPPGACC